MISIGVMITSITGLSSVGSPSGRKKIVPR
jgi:hypothetical protein